MHFKFRLNLNLLIDLNEKSTFKTYFSLFLNVCKISPLEKNHSNVPIGCSLLRIDKHFDLWQPSGRQNYMFCSVADDHSRSQKVTKLFWSVHCETLSRLIHTNLLCHRHRNIDRYQL